MGGWVACGVVVGSAAALVAVERLSLFSNDCSAEKRKRGRVAVASMRSIEL